MSPVIYSNIENIDEKIGKPNNIYRNIFLSSSQQISENYEISIEYIFSEVLRLTCYQLRQFLINVNI